MLAFTFMVAEHFGEMPDGRVVRRLTIGREPGPVLHLLELGATIHRLQVTTPTGARRNVVLGHSTVEDHLESPHFIGATIGRYANRIAGASFALDGVEHHLSAHDRGNNLHGGPDGFDRRLWDVLEHGADHALLECVSPDGDQGFPGRVTARVRFEVQGDTVRATYTAETDAPTVVSMTGHTYFNLDGEDAATIDDHLLAVPADRYTPTDATSIPLGEHADVADTPFDFRTPARLGDAVRRDHPQLLLARGIDHNYVVRGTGMRELAVLSTVAGGLELSLRSDQPGLQVYTGNFLDGTQRGTSGGLYRQGAGIALEPQHFPDSPHHPEWPSTVLRPGEEYRTVCELVVTPLAARRP